MRHCESKLSNNEAWKNQRQMNVFNAYYAATGGTTALLFHDTSDLNKHAFKRREQQHARVELILYMKCVKGMSHTQHSCVLEV